jgi:hypothetical protein
MKITLTFIFSLLAAIPIYAQLNFDTSAYLKNNAGIYSIIIAKNGQVLSGRSCANPPAFVLAAPLIFDQLEKKAY